MTARTDGGTMPAAPLTTRIKRTGDKITAPHTGTVYWIERA